jgi:hypothetical protein
LHNIFEDKKMALAFKLCRKTQIKTFLKEEKQYNDKYWYS